MAVSVPLGALLARQGGEFGIIDRPTLEELSNPAKAFWMTSIMAPLLLPKTFWIRLLPLDSLLLRTRDAVATKAIFSPTVSVET